MALSKEEQERYKQRWQNRNTNSGTSTNTGSSVATGSTASGLSESEKKRYTDRWNSRYDLDQTYLDTFFNDADEFLNRVQTDYNKLDYQSATAASSLDYYKSLRNTESDLSARAQKVQRYLDTYKDKMDANKYNDLSAYLSNFTTPKFSQQFFDARDYYSQWENEDAYNQAVTQQKEYESKKTADLGSLQKEIDSLQAVYDEAESIALKRGMGGGYDMDEYLDEQIRSILSKAGNGEYTKMSDLEKAIAQKSAYLNQAKVIQNGIRLAGVTGNSDFAANSGYTSTKSDAWHSGLTSKFGMGYDDLTYEYINGKDNGMRSEIYQKAVSRDAKTDMYDLYDRMTDEQISIYNYHYATGGKEVAEEYLDSIIESLSYQEAQDRFSKIKDNTALELLFAIEAGVDQFQSGIKNLFSGDDYIPTTSTQYVSGMVREDFDTGFGKGVYDLITTGANMAPSILTSIVVGAINPALGGYVGNALMGASAAGNAYASAINSGYDKGSARFYAASIGASEVVLGQLIGGISKLGGITPALEKALSGIDNGLARFALQYGGQMVSEGIEEGLQEILDPIMKNAILHADESINWSEVAYSALLGALSAGIMEAPGAVVGAVTDAKLNNAAVNQYGEFTGDLIQEGLQSDPTSESYQLAQKFQQQTEQGKEMTGRQIRQLVDANEAQFKVEDYDAAVSTAKDKLTALGESDVDNIANLAAKRATGQKLTKAERSTLAKSQYGAQVAKEISDEAKVVAEATKLSYKPVTERVKEKDIPAVSKTGKTVDTSTGNTIDMGKAKITDIAKDGSVTIETSDGTKVDADSIEFATKDHSYAISAVAAIENMTPESADVLLKAIDFSGDVKAQIAGLDEAYTYGFNKYSVEDMKSGDFASVLTDEQMMSAYNMGQLDKDHRIEASETRVMRTKAQADAIRANNEAIGKRVEGLERGVYHMNGTEIKDFDDAGKDLDDARMGGVVAAKFFKELGIGRRYFFYESYVRDGVVYYRDQYGVEKENAPNGMYITETGDIYIDLNAGNAMDGLTGFTLGHELGHFIKDKSLKQFERLAGIIEKMYSKTNRSLHDRVLAKQRQLSAKKPVSYEYAKEEVICDALSTMITDGTLFEKLEEIKSVDKGLWESIKQFFRDLIDKFRKAYEKLTPDQQDAKDIRALKGMFDELQTAFAEALVEASDNLQASLTPGVESIATNQNGEPVAYSTEDGSVMLSMRTYEENGRTELRKYLEKCVSSKKLTKTEMQEMLDGIEEIYNICKEFKDKYAPFSSWSDAAVVRDTHGRPVFSVVTPNGDYKMNLDFSLVCKKRRTLDAVFNEMSKRGIIDDFELGQKSVVKINEIIRSYGLETACALCFVDAKRFRQASVADSFTNLYNELVLSLVPEDKRSSIDHFNFAGYETIKAVENGIHTWKASDLDFSHLDYVMKNYASGTVEHKAAKYIKAHAEGRKLLLRGDFMSSNGFDAVKTQNPAMMKLYNAKKGTGGPKAAFGDVQYLNEIVKKANTWTPAKAYEVGGIRIQSFSDYVPRMVFDYVQMIYDLAATKLPAHAYSKEALFVKQFGLTGIKINMSLIPAIAEGGIAPGLDANGNYVWAGESFDYETAKEIQNAEGYTENCGTICVGVSYQHIVKLLGDPNIRMVIPYHKSGLNPIVAHMNKLAEFTDYTSLKTNPGGCQSTMDKNGSKVAKDFNFNEALRETGDPKAAARQYLDWCAANEYKPRFAEFAWHENYYKLLEDFTLYDKDGNYVPQREVRAVFPKDGAAFGSMKELIESGLEEDAILEGKRDSSLPSIVDEIQRTLPKTEAEISEEQVAQADHDLEAVKRSDRDYMDAVNRGDMETAQRMVNEAAKRAGFTSPILFHGTSKFGFTKFDPAFSDDKMSIFLSSNNLVAETYSGKTENYKVSQRPPITPEGLDKASPETILKLLQENVDYRIEMIGEGETKQIIKKHRGELKNAIRMAEQLPVLMGDKWNGSAQKDLDKVIASLMDLAEASTYNEFMDAYNDYEGALFDMRWENDTATNVLNELIRGDVNSAYRGLTNYLGTTLYRGNTEYTKRNGKDIFNINEAVSELYKVLFRGVYQLYTNPGNQLVIDAKGSNWNQIDGKHINASGPVRTRDVAKYAKENGYDSVLIKNLRDSGDYSYMGTSDVYIFFGGDRLKSADAVTYDDSGNVIPLSERFNAKNDDIRYSERASNKELAGMDDTALYIKNTANADYIGMIFNGAKTEETRSRRTLDAFIGKDFYVTDGKYVYGSIVLGEPHKYTEAEFHNRKNQLKHRVPKGDKYDIKPGETKWAYPIESYKKFDEPKKLSDSPEYKNSFQARQVRYSDRDYVAYHRTAILKEETVDRWLKDYAAPSSPKYAQAYIAYMSPDEFLELTTSDYKSRNRIESESYDLDEEKFAKTTSDQPLQLRIDHDSGEVWGHEGRHRCVALKNAGIENVPVLLFDSSNKYSKEDITSLLLKGQFNEYHREIIYDAIPLSYENRERVVKEFATQSEAQRFFEKRGTKNTLRYSERDANYQKAMEKLEEQNEKLRADVEHLKEMVKLQGTLTHGTMFTPTSVEAAARVLKKSADADCNTKELAALLNDLYQYIAKGEELTWEGVKEHAQPAVDMLMESKIQRLDPYAEEVLAAMKGNKVYLTEEQKQEVRYIYGSINNFRSAIAGSVVLVADSKSGISLDSWWHEMAGLYPDKFDGDITSTDQPAALADLVGELTESESYDDMERAANIKFVEQDLLRQVYDSYWNVSTLRTVADVKQKQIDRLKMDHAERMRALKEAHKDDMQKIRKENREKMRAAAERSADRRDKADLRRKIRKTIMDLDKILNRGNKQRNVKEGMKDLASKALALQAADKAFIDDYSNEDVIRNGFTTTLSDAEAKLAQECAEMLAAIDNTPSGDYDAVQARLEAERKLDYKMSKLKDAFERERKALNSTSATKLIGDLADAYKAMEKSTEKYVQGAYQEAVYNYLVSLKENVGGTPVKDMTASQLEYLLQGYKMVLHSIRTANKLFASSKAATIDQVVNSIAADFGKRKIPSKEIAIVAQKLANKIGWNYEKLYYALDRIGSDAFTELYMNLANSENIVMRDVMEAAAFRDQMVKEYGYNTWKVDQKIDKEFLDNTGKKFKLTLGELMALYAYSRREGAYDHIEYGGFMFGKEDLADPNPANTYKLNRNQLKAVTDTLTEKQKAYAEAMQKYLSDTMGNKGNEVSMLLYGIKMFGEENYFPIHVYGVFKAQAQESQAKAAAGFQSMSNAGFTHAQNRTAKAPVILEGFNEVWTDHVNEMSRYHGTVPALEDIRKVMNRSFYADNMTDSTAIKQLMVNKYGEAAMKYFDDLYREANSGAITDKLQSTSKKMLSLFRKNSVAYSLSVLVQQPASLVRAYAMIDRKYFGVKGFGAITSGVAKAVSSKWNKAYANAYNEMLQYAPGVTMAKEIGGFDTATGGSIRSYLLDTGKSLKQKWKTEDALGKGKAVMDLVDDNPIANLPNVADKIAWIEIWNACKRETLATHKGLKANSEEFMQAVGKRFTEVIRATQVYDSIFSKSPMLKSKNLAVQYLVSFMNEPNTVANMAESALRDIASGNRTSGLRKVHVLIHSVIFTGVLKSIIYAMRDDDEDETYIEKYIESLTGSLLDDFNPLNYIPILRDVWSIAQGYDVERADMAIVSDTINALTKVIETAAKNRDGMTEDELVELDKKLTEAGWNLVDSLAAIAGIPIKNVRREINALIDHARIASENAGKNTMMSAWDTISEAVIESIPFMSNAKTKGDKIYAAITKGDQVYLDRLKATYKTDDAFHNAVRKALRENDPRIKEAAEAHVAGDPSKRVQIAKQIIADIGNEYFDDVVTAINSEISAMTDSGGGSGASKAKGYYTAADLMAEAANGDWTAADQIKADIIDTAQNNGKTKAQAEEAFEDSVQTNAKKAYMDGNLTDAAANRLLVDYAGKDATDAEERVRYWKFIKDNPAYEDYTEATVNGYYDHAVPVGISMAAYDKYVTGTADLATIYDRNGKELISKRSQVLRVINSLPLTVYQKDALYLAAGYAESKIGEVPWR